jgi:hypothetical protein
MDINANHDEQRDGGWDRLAALFGSLPFRQLAGPAGVFLFWPLRPPPRGQDGRDASSAHARRLA